MDATTVHQFSRCGGDAERVFEIVSGRCLKSGGEAEMDPQQVIESRPDGMSVADFLEEYAFRVRNYGEAFWDKDGFIDADRIQTVDHRRN
jgi:hypothetical protein